MTEMRAELLKKARRIVIKIGSRIIASRGRGLNKSRIAKLALEILKLRERKCDVAIVSSGAIIAGMEKLGIEERPKTMPLKQAAAAVGQSQLMWLYEKTFKAHRAMVAQILLTGEDLSDRKRSLNARNTLFTLFDRGVIPVVNENDTVSFEEIKFGDNDHLAALVTRLIDADLLIILTDVDGLYTADPRNNPQARRLDYVAKITAEMEKNASGTGSMEGTGGMRSKISAAKSVGALGVPTLLLNGARPEILTEAFDGQPVGTLFNLKGKKPAGRKPRITGTIKKSAKKEIK